MGESVADKNRQQTKKNKAKYFIVKTPDLLIANFFIRYVDRVGGIFVEVYTEIGVSKIPLQSFA
jgi:hypothetical protein